MFVLEPSPPFPSRPVVARTRPSPSAIRLGYQRAFFMGATKDHVPAVGSNTATSARPLNGSYAWVPPAESSRPSARNASPPQNRSKGRLSGVRNVAGVVNVLFGGVQTVLTATPLATSPKSGERNRVWLLQRRTARFRAAATRHERPVRRRGIVAPARNRAP